MKFFGNNASRSIAFALSFTGLELGHNRACPSKSRAHWRDTLCRVPVPFLDLTIFCNSPYLGAIPARSESDSLNKRKAPASEYARMNKLILAGLAAGAMMLIGSQAKAQDGYYGNGYYGNQGYGYQERGGYYERPRYYYNDEPVYRPRRVVVVDDGCYDERPRYSHHRNHGPFFQVFFGGR